MAAPTWSVSRDQTLHICERRYYFQYLARARINSKDETLREIAFLKKLKSFPMWKGNAFHSLVAEYLQLAREGKSPRIAGVISNSWRRMKHEWDFSVSRGFRSNPRAIDREDGLALFEHEYDQVLGEEAFETAFHDIEEQAHKFVEWAISNDIVSSVQGATRVWIEPRPYGPRAPGFILGNVQVLTKVDLALENSDQGFEIFDWKTGEPSLRPSRQIDQAEFQVNVYQLWPHLTRGHSLNSIKAHLVHFAPDTVQRTFSIDQNLREYTLGLVRRSVDRVLHFEDLRKQEGLGIEDLDFAAFPWACRRCHFKRICQRGLDHE